MLLLRLQGRQDINYYHCMKEIFMLTILSLLFVFNTSSSIKQEGISINEIYLKLAKKSNVNYQKVDGEFIYPENNEKGGSYIARFFTKQKAYTIVHTAYPGVRKDVFRFNSQLFELDAKIDPLSLVVYRLTLGNKRYLCLIGKGRSASGSGVQVSYFNVFELDKLGKAIFHYEFSSRFGNIHSIINYNGNVSYFKIVNGNEMNQYMLTVNDIKSGKRSNNRLVMLDYKFNDKFVVLKDTM